jgi:hypothetical protein
VPVTVPGERGPSAGRNIQCATSHLFDPSPAPERLFVNWLFVIVTNVWDRPVAIDQLSQRTTWEKLEEIRMITKISSILAAALILGSVSLVTLFGLSAQGQPVGPMQTYCERSFTVTARATSITEFVRASTGKRIVVCGYVFEAGAAGVTFQLSYGTKVNCNVGTTVLPGPWALGINGELTNRGTSVGEVTPVSQALCYAITGTGLLTAVVYFDQY